MRRLIDSKSAFRKITWIGFVLVLVLFLSEFRRIGAVTDYPLIRGAHRGASADNIENTLPAIEEAVEDSKYKFIEFDVQYTLDKKMVVFHDFTLARMYHEFRQVGALDYDELEEATDSQIPLYSEVMDTIGKKKKISIEIKPTGEDELDKEMVDEIIDDCKERGVLSNIIIISTYDKIIDYASHKYPEIKTGMVYLVHPVTYIHSKELVKEFYDYMDKIGARYVVLHGVNTKNYDLLTELKPENKTLMFWYFTDEIYIMQEDPTDKLW